MSSRRTKNNTKSTTDDLLAKSDQFYGKVNKALGDKRFDCTIDDETSVIAKCPNGLGKGPKKVYINVGDYVLLTLDPSTSAVDGSKKKYFIICKYTKDEMKFVSKMDKNFFKCGFNSSYDTSDVNGKASQVEESVMNVVNIDDI
jgi:translation initiation factor IF-1